MSPAPALGVPALLARNFTAPDNTLVGPVGYGAVGCASVSESTVDPPTPIGGMEGAIRSDAGLAFATFEPLPQVIQA